MSFARLTPESAVAAPHGRLYVAAFSATLFLSAFLLFSVQPLFTKMILPTLGGSPAVWSVAMVFFQAALLLGYAYAHWLTKNLGLARAAGVHVLVMLIALFALPIGIAPGWVDPPDTGQALWLLAVFALSIGAPFFAVAANGPLIQAWFARSGHSHANDPYFLYGASNVGSLLALLSYPFLIEPVISLSAQGWLWAFGYGGLIASIAGVAALAQMGRNRSSEKSSAFPDTATAAPATGRQKLTWIGLAFVPSALLVAVTAHLSTDVASAPFLWVVPLSLFLLTFVITFQQRPIIPHTWMLGLQPLIAGTALTVLALGFSLPWSTFIMLDLGALFVVAMVCHGELVRRRPAATNLTSFYLWMSLGGVLGGIFAGLAAPFLFSTVLEFPLLLVLSLFCRPGVFTGDRSEWRKVIVIASIAAIAVAGIGIIVDSVGLESPTAMLALQGLVIAAIASFLLLHRLPARLAGVAAVFFICGQIVAPTASDTTNLRGFFGVHKIRNDEDGKHRMLLHGTTVHGAQRLVVDANGTRFDPDPLAYYHWGGPLAEAVKTARRSGLRSAGLIGLGTGAMACHALPGEAFTFFEIDPLVIEIAEDPNYFGYLSACPPSGGIVLGDARLTLADQPKSAFDLIVLDAFSSDSIPVHLLTVEAVRLYFNRITETGFIAFHVSNRNMDLRPAVAAAARELGAHAYYRDDPGVPEDELKYSSRVVVVGRPGGTIERFSSNRDWSLVSDTTARAWTDDYSNVLGAIWTAHRAKSRSTQ